MGRISLLPRVILEVSLPRRISSMISKRWDRLCTKFRVADALQVKRRLWWGCTRCSPPDDRHVHESIALLRQASGQQGSDVAETEVARGLRLQGCTLLEMFDFTWTARTLVSRQMEASK